MVVLATDPVPPKPGKIRHRGALLDVTYLAWSLDGDIDVGHDRAVLRGRGRGGAAVRERHHGARGPARRPVDDLLGLRDFEGLRYRARAVRGLLPELRWAAASISTSPGGTR
jgi:hypothetical protein